jgi:hypothetical protein
MTRHSVVVDCDDAQSDRSADFASAAVELAAAGWDVFPAHPTGPWAKSPVSALVPHGHLEASRDPDVIRRWWRRCPNAMIAAPVPASLMVTDIDPRNGGSAEALEALVGPLPTTLTAWSGRNDGGRHLYFLRPAGEFTSSRLPAGIDLKVRGYCVVPPSVHPATGSPYRWEIHEPAPLPSRLRELLRPRPIATRRVSRTPTQASALVRFVAGLEPGERNRGTFWAACRAADGGTLPLVGDALVAAAVATGLPEHEASRIVASAVRTTGAHR